MQNRAAYLEALGITDWRLRGAARVADAVAPDVPVASAVGVAARPSVEAAITTSIARPVVTASPSTTTDSWESLATEVSACTKCGLSACRTRTVFGVGDRRAHWLIVGEAPGADEDRQGEPFVGRAGQLLNAMLRGIGLEREQVFIANVLKCRPPNNRDPAREEVEQCMPYLQRQVALLQPRIMLAVGRIAAQNVLATDTPIGKLRGRLHHFGTSNIPLVVTYHPAYLLRSPTEKRKAWEDLKFARSVYRGLPA